MTFRIKLQVDPKVLQTFYTKVKTGVRGMGFVRTKGDVDWPAELQIKLPTPPEVKAPQATAPAAQPDAKASETKTPDAK